MEKNPVTPRSKLFCPGPTPVREAARKALTNCDVYHRSDVFYEAFLECREMLKPFFGTERSPLILTCSGTGAMEAAMVNLTEPGDVVTVVVGGKFGERWQELADTYQCKVQTIELAYGSSPSPEQVMEKVHGSKALFIQATETSTGASFPVRDICKLIRPKFSGLIVVDAISAMVADPILMDENQIDCVVSGSQKGFGIPPGLAFIALSQKAESIMNQSQRSKYYFDLQRETKGQIKGRSAFTPASNLVGALHASLKELIEIGADELVKHHEVLAEATRSAASALELELFAKDRPANTLTAIKIPPKIDGTKLLASIQQDDGVIFAGGQGSMKGQILRIAHLGLTDRLDLLSAIAALEMGLAKHGHRFSLGSGVAAALNHLKNNQ